MSESMETTPLRVERIPIARIHILNPRSRGRTKFRQIVRSIETLGLKRPITVSRREADDDYDLVCGQGRLEAMQLLGATEVPALVIAVPLEDRYLMSLVENLARRRPSCMAAIEEMARLEAAGNTQSEIASKLGCSPARVSTLLRFHHDGEERLARAVERGELPLEVAAELARAGDKNVQQVLETAYKEGKLRGKALKRVRRMLEERRSRAVLQHRKPEDTPAPTVESLLRVYKRETQRHRLLVSKAGLCETRLTFMVSALRKLTVETEFVTLLRDENLSTMPKFLAERLERAP